MYNPTAYWGQTQIDLTASVLANYRGVNTVGNTVSYSFNGVTQSATITAPPSATNFTASGYNTFCMDIKTQTSAYNPLDQNASITATPFFGNSNSIDGKSDFSPIQEAWYVKVTNDSPLRSQSPFHRSIQFSYIDQNGLVQLLQLAWPDGGSPESAIIITQNIGWNFFNEAIAGLGRDYIVEVISKYTGNVTAYPYINVPIRYIKNPSATNNATSKYLYYQPTGSNGGVVQSGSFVLFPTGSSVISTNFPAIYNPPQDGPYETNLALIPTGVPAAKPIYKLTNCLTSASITASFTDWAIYDTQTILSLTSSAVSGCYTINQVTNSITPTYTNVIPLANYGTCYDCINPPTGSNLRINYLIVGGGGGGGQTNANYAAGGGGGAGQFISGTLDLSAGSTLPAVVGIGGAVNNNGTSSTFLGYTALGGGAGGASGSNGNNGASGGGGGIAAIGLKTAGGTGSAGFNGGGGVQYASGGLSLRGQTGGGGGSTSPGLNAITAPFDYESGAGGSGSLWLDGKYYAAGGGGGAFQNGGNVALGGNGIGGNGAIDRLPSYAISATTASVNRGSGGGGGADTTYIGSAGSNGVVTIRYFGSGIKATGGTITYSGSYTYHTFTSNGSFSLI